MGDPVTQIVAMRRVGGKAEVLVQWACSWKTVEQLTGQAVAQILDIRTKDGVFEVLVQWCCTWTDVDDELMAGDMWQPFLDGQAIAEADEEEEESGEDEVPTVGEKREETKGVRRSLRRKNVVED